MTRERLESLCAKHIATIERPFLRRRGKSIWTVATNAHALIAVRGKFAADNVAGPTPAHVRCMFRSRRWKSFCQPPGWGAPHRYSWTELRRFVRMPRATIDGAVVVRVGSVVVNAVLLRRFMLGLDADTVTLRASRSRIHFAGVSTPECLRIDAPDWSIVVMSMCRSDAVDVFPGKARRR